MLGRGNQGQRGNTSKRTLALPVPVAAPSAFHSAALVSLLSWSDLVCCPYTTELFTCFLPYTYNNYLFRILEVVMSSFFYFFFLFSFMDQSSTKTQHGKLQTACPMSNGLDGSLDLPLIPGIVDCNTFVSLGLDPIPVYSSPWQISHGSDIYNILKSLTKSRLYLHSLTKWHIPGLSGLP